MRLTVKPFNQLTVDELYEILRIRVDVFVVEQNCPYPETDGVDKSAIHLYLSDEDGIQAYARVVPAGVKLSEPSIGRIVTRRRRCGLGSRIVTEGIRIAREQFSAEKIVIEAQQYAKPFYEQLGFVQVSEPFMMDNIPHIKMVLE